MIKAKRIKMNHLMKKIKHLCRNLVASSFSVAVALMTTPKQQKRKCDRFLEVYKYLFINRM